MVPVSGETRSYDRDHRVDTRARNTRLVMAGAFAGALVVLALSTVFSWSIGGEQSLTEKAFAAPKGSCLSWGTPDARDIEQVPCTTAHQFEVLGAVTAPVKGANPPRPSRSEWQRITQEKCTIEAQTYLGGKLDPYGRFSVGALTPTQDQWDDGERSMRCGLQHAGTAGQPLAVTGSAKDTDQSDVHEPGTCLGITGNASVGDPVDCSQKHVYEIVGNVDLGKEFTDGYPPEDKQSAKLPDLCNSQLKDYSGSPAPPKGLVITWDTRQKESWDAGSKRVDCKVAGELSGNAKTLQPVTGSIGQSSGGPSQPGTGSNSKPGSRSGGPGQ
jgi:hypothetical protein